MAGRQPLKVFLELGERRVFAGALDWPGWCRIGKGEQEAIAALFGHAARYAKVARAAKVPFAPPAADSPVKVVSRLKGGTGTDFGVPGVAMPAEDKPLRGRELARQRALLAASWKAFDAAARKSAGRTLRAGPRGGGRDAVKMTGHVLEAEAAYVGGLGNRPPPADGSADVAAHMRAIRRAGEAALEALAAGKPMPDPRNTKHPWSARYYIRRSAWHALDHAWEIEDRLNP